MSASLGSVPRLASSVSLRPSLSLSFTLVVVVHEVVGLEVLSAPYSSTTVTR